MPGSSEVFPHAISSMVEAAGFARNDTQPPIANCSVVGLLGRITEGRAMTLPPEGCPWIHRYLQKSHCKRKRSEAADSLPPLHWQELLGTLRHAEICTTLSHQADSVCAPGPLSPGPRHQCHSKISENYAFTRATRSVKVLFGATDSSTTTEQVTMAPIGYVQI